MLKRRIESVLVEWKNSESKKPLVIKGIRQCGKTYIVQKFAKENYESVVYMNFILVIVSAKRYHHSGVSGTIVSLKAVPL